MTRRDVLKAVALFLVILVVVVGWMTEEERDAEANRIITCVSAETNIEQLDALEELFDQLGVPHEFTVPEVPPECLER